MLRRPGLGLLIAAAAMVSACGGTSSGSPPNQAPPADQPPLPAPGPPGTVGAFGAAEQVMIVGYVGDIMEPFLSNDGKLLFFNNRNDPASATDLFYARTIDGLKFAFQGPVEGANSDTLDAVASLDAANTFYFVSLRSYDTSLSTIYSATFSDGRVTPPTIVAGISPRKPATVNFDAEISADGRTLWFDDGDYSAQGKLLAATLVVADRQGADFVRRPDSAAILATVNAAGQNYAPAISGDGLELFFTRIDPAVDGGVPAIYQATRSSVTAPFGVPHRVVTATGFVAAPTLAANGSDLYFHKFSGGIYSLFRLHR